MCSTQEEPFVLQQFLRFGETRTLLQHMLIQEITEKSNEEQRARAQLEIKKSIERNVIAALASAASPQGPRPPMQHNNNNNGHPPPYLMRNSHASHEFKPERGDVSPARSHPSPGGHDARSASASSPSNASSSAMVSPGGPGAAGQPSHPLSSPPTSSTPSSINGTALPPSSPLSASSPLNRLQNMQPFDYRKAGERKTPDPRDHRGIERPIPPSMRLPPSSMAAAAAAAAGLGMPLMPNVNLPHHLANYHNSMTSLGKVKKHVSFVFFKICKNRDICEMKVETLKMRNIRQATNVGFSQK